MVRELVQCEFRVEYTATFDALIKFKAVMLVRIHMLHSFYASNS